MENERHPRKNHRGVFELVKTLLIVLLALSAVYLTARTQFYTGLGTATPSGWVGNLFELFQSKRTPPPVAEVADSRAVMAAHAVRISIHNGQERFAVQYDTAQADKTFDAVSGLLSEGLASAKTPREITQRQWQAALGQPGVYFDFLGAIPLEALYAWLGEEGGNPALIGTARRVLLAWSGGETVTLYYSNESEGMYYACETAVVYTGHLEDEVQAHSGNDAAFAFELDAEQGYAGLSPYVLIFPAAPAPKSYHSGNPLAGDEARLGEVERVLSFRPQANSVYPIPGGTVIREGKETLQISSSGTIVYHAAEPEASRYPIDHGSSATETIEAARRLAAATVGAWCGSARLYLLDYTPGADGSVELRFGYSLDGAAVQLYEDGYAAKFVLRDGHITDYTLCFRAYEESGARTAVLPERQAAAALTALRPTGRELILCYEDSGGESLQAGWVAQ